MVSSNEAGVDLREMFPLSREYLAYPRSNEAWMVRGQRMNPEVWSSPKDYRGWSVSCASLKAEASHLDYLASIRDTAKSGLGLVDNCHLNYFVASIFMNVGGYSAEVSSQPVKHYSVGGVIVVGARESRVHGEGRQESNTFPVER